MRVPSEALDFCDHFDTLRNLPGSCSPEELIQLMSTPDARSLLANDNPKHSALSHFLMNDNDQIRRSTRFYIILGLIKNSRVVNFLTDLLYPNRITEIGWRLEMFLKTKLGDQGFAVLCLAIAELPISTLELPSFQFVNSDGLDKKRTPELLSSFQNVTTLKVTTYTRFDSKDLSTWANFCDAGIQLPQLRSLILRESFLGQMPATEWQHLKNLSQLSYLDLSGNSLGVDSEKFINLCDALKSLPNLTSLNLSNNHIEMLSNEGWQAFAPVMASLKGLSLASLYQPDRNNVSIKLDSWRAIHESAANSTLASLDLSKNKYFLMRLDDASFDLFCKFITDSKNLSKLNLSCGCLRKISKERFEKFCTAIIEATHLSDLDIGIDLINDQLMPILLEAITKATHLKSIHLPHFLSNQVVWKLFWNTFNSAIQITHINLRYFFSYYSNDTSGFAEFIQGLAEARHLRSVRFDCDVDSRELNELLSALESLFNLVELEYEHGFLPQPRISQLLRRNNHLNQTRTKLETITTQLNSSNKPDLNQVTQSVATATEFTTLLASLPDILNANIYRKEAQLILDDFHFSAALYLASNNEPIQAIHCYTQIALGCSHFSKARENAFSMAFNSYRNEGDSCLHAFTKSLSLCLDEEQHLLSLDATYQRVFDGFFMQAIGISNSLHLLSDITPQIRLNMLKFLSLLVLKEELNEKKSPHTTSYFFHKIQIPQILEELEPVSSLDQLSALEVDAILTNVTNNFIKPPFSFMFESFSLLRHIIRLQEEALAIAETNQKIAALPVT